jgi:2-dehydropantoate 2-reductase
MRILIVGSGAVGGYFGGRLAQAGQDITFLARDDNLRALSEQGLRIEGGGRDFTVSPVKAIASPDGGDSFDLVIVCVKVLDTLAAVSGLRPHLGEAAIVISLQNGVESEPTIERALGLPPMLRALAFIGAELVAPGIIHLVEGGTIVVGEEDGRRSQRLDRLEHILRDAGIEVRVPGDVRRAKWQKLAWNAAFNVVAALSGKNVAELLARPSARRLVEDAMEEVRAVAAAQGIEFEKDYIPRVLRVTERDIGPVRPSTLQDRERGKPLEHDALTGAVVRFGERFGVPTPIHRALNTLAELVSTPPPRKERT